MLLSVAYFPPVSWFAAAARGFVLSPDAPVPAEVCIEACENYCKQTWRNRCRIYSASGPENLNVPVVHEGGTFKLPITQIRVDYTEPWVVRTERAIASAYESSPFFEYYRDDIFAILDSRPDTLWELDMALIRYFLRKIGIAANISFTGEYIREYPAGDDILPYDLRGAIHPKRPDHVLRTLGLERPYWQVFAHRHGFIPNLSIMDLLFGEGPNAISYLL